MHSKVSSDWLKRYIKATQPALETFKIAGYLLESVVLVEWAAAASLTLKSPN